MANITFTEASGVADSIYGNSQAPIRMFLEKRGEAFEAESALPNLFKMEKSSHWGEKLTSMTAMEGFMPVGENGATPTDGFQEGFSKFLEHMTWKDSFAISREMVEDAKLMDLKKQPAAFVTGYYRTREQFGAALLNAAVSVSATTNFRGKVFDTKCADGHGLFYHAHPSAISSKSATQSNLFTDAFSADALAAVECAMQGFKGDNGEILDVTPDTIIIPNEYALKKAVFATIGADKDPDTANNGFNYHFGRWNVIVWPYLTVGNHEWIVLDSKYNQENGGAVWFDRTPLDIKSRIDDNTDANVWSGFSRFVAGFNDWRAFACAGSANASATTLIES